MLTWALVGSTSNMCPIIGAIFHLQKYKSKWTLEIVTKCATDRVHNSPQPNRMNPTMVVTIATLVKRKTAHLPDKCVYKKMFEITILCSEITLMLLVVTYNSMIALTPVVVDVRSVIIGRTQVFVDEVAIE
jgi:hypothetical protein